MLISIASSWAPKYRDDGRKEFFEHSRRQIGYPTRSPVRISLPFSRLNVTDGQLR